MKKLFTILFICLSGNIFGQGTQSIGSTVMNLDVSNLKPTILNGGDMFHDLQNPNPSYPMVFNEGFEAPRGSGKHTFYSAALWLGGTDNSQNLYVAAQHYRQGYPMVNCYWPGPITNNHNAAHSAKYDKIWKVSQAEIQYHKTHFNKLSYNMPASIATWPGNGNTSNGEAAQLAPFVDANNDGIYSPALGDYPSILGDQALYFILNDKGGIKVPLSATANLEIHVMYYGYDMPGNGPVFNTNFCQYRIINRGQIPLQNFYAGLWADFELGNFADDFVGCDSLANRFYCYNGDNDDEGPMGYGLYPPVQSVTFLDKSLNKMIFYNNDNDVTNGNPRLATEYYNYLKATWKDGKQLTYGEVGTNQARPVTSKMFTGNPLTGQGWSEQSVLNTPNPNFPSDRRSVGSTGPYLLLPGQEIKFTVAFTFSWGNSTINSLTVAQQDAQAVQNFFKNKILAISRPMEEAKKLDLYPNPATDKLTIQLPNQLISKKSEIQITDVTGRTVLSTNSRLETSELKLDIAALPKGLYLVRVSSDNQVFSARLVKM